MMESPITPVQSCGCDPFPGPEAGGVCPGCHPNMALTCEEESILGRMRHIKGQVRPIADRLQELQGNVSASPPDYDAEWDGLSAQLEDLRSQWKEWAAKLEGAIERKLIALGHREPSA